VQSIAFDKNLTLPVEQVLLSDFGPDLLENNDLVIFDALQRVTPEVQLAINVCAHHQSLASLFVITHSLLGSKNFDLLSLCHRVFLFVGSSANTRLTKYILDHFYADPEVKDYLKTVLNFCSSQNEVLALELSPIGHTPPIVLAFSHFSRLISANDEDANNSSTGSDTVNPTSYCFLYPTPHFGDTFVQRFARPEQAPALPATSATMSIAFLHTDAANKMPANTLIALPAQFVMAQNREAAAATAEGGPSTSASGCADRLTWESTLEDIEDNIESFFPIKRWKVCKNLAKEILSNSKFCITRDGKYFHQEGKPQTKVNLVSFLGVVTRKAGPNEKTLKPEWKMYHQHMRELLNTGTPKELFVNSLFLNKKTLIGSRNKRQK